MVVGKLKDLGSNIIIEITVLVPRWYFLGRSKFNIAKIRVTDGKVAGRVRLRSFGCPYG